MVFLVLFSFFCNSYLQSIFIVVFKVTIFPSLKHNGQIEAYYSFVNMNNMLLFERSFFV